MLICHPSSSISYTLDITDVVPSLNIDANRVVTIVDRVDILFLEFPPGSPLSKFSLFQHSS
jgi:hypothetical protein